LSSLPAFFVPATEIVTCCFFNQRD
jgi:hypothetical protein